MSSKSRKSYIVDFNEGIHHFIHSGELAIHNRHRAYSYVAFGDYLYKIDARVREIKHITDPKTYHIGRGDYVVAVVDREKKRICISDKTVYTYALSHATPDDWEKTFVNGAVHSFYKCGEQNDYAFCFRVCMRIVQKVLETYNEEYAIVYKRKTAINKNIDVPAIGMEHKETIKLLLDKYNLAGFWFYEQPITDNLYIEYYKGWTKKWFALDKVPTIKEIYENNIFTKEERLYLIQRKFYTDYCRGFNIPFNEVVKHWNDKNGTDILHTAIKAQYSKLKPYWTDAIVANAKYRDKSDERFVKHNLIQSHKNREQAIVEYVTKGERKDIVTIWREENINFPITITYKNYVVTNHSVKGRYTRGRWVDKTERIYYMFFDHIQLKYDAGKDIITTSEGAKVRLADAVSLWNLYKETIKGKDIGTNKTPKYVAVRLVDKGLKCGLYPITGIFYSIKNHNNDGTIDWCWNVVIGCHTIWIDDFINFVEYYKLQKYFPN